MANQEQLEILKQGIRVWNQWRAKEPSKVKWHLNALNIDLADADEGYFNRVNLDRANLQGKKLDNINLVRANLRKADLREATFHGANLSGANLSGAKLQGADLSGAYLQRTNFEKADLSRSDLQRAFAGHAKFNFANLAYAKFDEGRFHHADFRGANLQFGGGISNPAVFSQADFRDADLSNALLINSYLDETNFSRANLRDAWLEGADLRKADLSHADLRGAKLSGSDLSKANLEHARLNAAYLTHAILVETNLKRANLSGCHIYGISAWGLNLQGTKQNGLIITPSGESVVTVDNLEVAQFIYLILNNKTLRNVLNTITSKAVLILGRFSIPERKAILDALRNKLREYNLLPIVFDFDRPIDKDFTETIKTLAGLSYFVIADVTNPKSSPLELQATVPDYQIPFVPIIQEGEEPFAMMVDLQKKYNWVLKTRSYDSIDTLLKTLKPRIINPAIRMHYKLRRIKARKQEIESLKDFLTKEKA